MCVSCQLDRSLNVEIGDAVKCILGHIRKVWVICKTYTAICPFFFDPAENGKVIKYFNIQRQISKYDMMLTKVKTLFEIQLPSAVSESTRPLLAEAGYSCWTCDVVLLYQC